MVLIDKFYEEKTLIKWQWFILMDWAKLISFRTRFKTWHPFLIVQWTPKILYYKFIDLQFVSDNGGLLSNRLHYIQKNHWWWNRNLCRWYMQKYSIVRMLQLSRYSRLHNFKSTLNFRCRYKHIVMISMQIARRATYGTN